MKPLFKIYESSIQYSDVEDFMQLHNTVSGIDVGSTIEIPGGPKTILDPNTESKIKGTQICVVGVLNSFSIDVLFHNKKNISHKLYDYYDEQDSDDSDDKLTPETYFLEQHDMEVEFFRFKLAKELKIQYWSHDWKLTEGTLFTTFFVPVPVNVMKHRKGN